MRRIFVLLAFFLSGLCFALEGIDNQAYNSQKQWSISLGGMDPGYYLLTFDAKVADIKKTMTCICILNLID